MSFLPSARSSSPHREGALSQAVYSPREQERALCAPNRLSPDRRKRGSQEYERSFTPLDLSITQLARGTFSPREFALVERSWRDTQNVEISPLGKDSSVYFMSVHGEKRAVIKIRQDERGSPRHQEISDNGLAYRVSVRNWCFCRITGEFIHAREFTAFRGSFFSLCGAQCELRANGASFLCQKTANISTKSLPLLERYGSHTAVYSRRISASNHRSIE